MDKEIDEISRKILNNIVNQLTLNLRFMDLALNQYEYVVSDLPEMECDGIHLFYNPIYVIKQYQNDPDALLHGYLHIVLHSVFRHHYLTFDGNTKIWNLACDIAVENMILELQLDVLSLDEERQREILKIKENVPVMSAQKIYRYINSEYNKDQIKLLEAMFHYDAHTKWYHLRDVVSSQQEIFGDEVKDDSSVETKNHFANATNDTEEDSPYKEEVDQKDLSERDLEKIRNSMKEWKKISEQIEVDLETFSRNPEHRSEAMVQSLKRLNRERYNYTTFLQKFMTIGEKQMINEDEFDYVFYTYGLQLYGNMPLIENLEYAETKNLKNLVIAIDTSGSVSGEIVQGFLQKTYNIFKQKENFFHRFHIRILQCDSQIREDKNLNHLSEFDEYIRNMEIKGLGGTDFRVVFQYVDELLKKKEMLSVDGLLYFTDGDGAYPKSKPSYQTAFIFLNENEYVNQVPPWAITYILDEDEIIEGDGDEY